MVELLNYKLILRHSSSCECYIHYWTSLLAIMVFTWLLSMESSMHNKSSHYIIGGLLEHVLCSIVWLTGRLLMFYVTCCPTHMFMILGWEGLFVHMILLWGSQDQIWWNTKNLLFPQLLRSGILFQSKSQELPLRHPSRGC